jgi:hypothetical protein
MQEKLSDIIGEVGSPDAIMHDSLNNLESTLNDMKDALAKGNLEAAVMFAKDATKQMVSLKDASNKALLSNEATKGIDGLLKLLKSDLIPALKDGDVAKANSIISQMKAQIKTVNDEMFRGALTEAAPTQPMLGLLDAARQVAAMLGKILKSGSGQPPPPAPAPKTASNGNSASKKSSAGNFLDDGMSQYTSKDGNARGFDSIQDGANKLIKINQKDRSALKDNDKIIVSCKAIGEGLQKLALAAKQKKREELILSGKGVYSSVAEFIKELRRIAANCRDPILQDKLYKQINALSNFSIQLKILSAVKASSIDSEKDSDQLVSVATSLEKVMADSVSTVNAVALL